MYDQLLKRGACLLVALTVICMAASIASSQAEKSSQISRGLPNGSIDRDSQIMGSQVSNTTQDRNASYSSSLAFNGTVYRLSEKNVQVTIPVNATHLNITLSDKAGNMTLIDGTGRPMNYSSSYQYWRGEHIYSLTFAGHVRGSLIYTTPISGQQFILPIQEKAAVRIILPQGYTTGERTLGIARPDPDEQIEDANGTALTWYNTTNIPYIEVNYYRRSAPQAMFIIFSIMILAGAVLFIQYYLSTLRLKKSSEELDGEADWKSRKK